MAAQLQEERIGNKVLLHNAGIITMDPGRRQYNSGSILIENDRIVRVGKSADLLEECGDDVERINLRRRWIFPRLINTHVHASQ
jgi:cytosine/adenosine deaminase-related metal-dependent hydrolase